MKFVEFFKAKGFSFWMLIFIIFWYFSADMLHHYWMRDEPGKRGIIRSDVMGYYAYVPAIFIYGDYTLEFTGEPGFRNESRFQYLRMENGKRVIQYTSGLAIAYTPFFLLAHAVAPALGEERDGFNWVYQFFLVMSGLFYVSLALVFLRKLLLYYFNDRVVAAALLLLCLGTNLYYYSVYESAVSHSYGFAFIALFICLVDRWYRKATVMNTVLIGLTYGFTVLMRPSNIFVGILLVLWGVKSFSGLRDRIVFLAGKIPLILLMIVFFVIPWVPQLLYWKSMTGHFFYNSYENVGSAFYFGAPQTHEMLFSYRKGWFVYTPLMLVAMSGFYFIYKQRREHFWSMFSYMAIMIYVLSSWWSWWFGGGFSCRAMVDTYAVMAFPLAILVENVFNAKRPPVKYGLITVLVLMLGLQLMQTKQYTNGVLHYVAMDKDAYWVDYFKLKGRRIWPRLSEPDHQMARLGIYYFYDWGADYDAYRELDEQVAKKEIRDELTSDKKIMRSIGRYARREAKTQDEAFQMVVDRIYGEKCLRQNLK